MDEIVKKECDCGPECTCGCNEGKPCTCGGKCKEGKTCDCGPECTCGCNEGKPCICGGKCKDGKKCKCGDNCKCGCHSRSCGGFSRFLAGLLIGGGLCAAGYFPGYYYYQTKMNANSVTVKGLSEMDVKADLAVWELKFVVTGNDLALAQQEMEQKGKLIAAFLMEQGFAAEEINASSINTNDLLANPYRSNDVNASRYILNQTITVRSHNVDLVEKSLGQTGSLISQGVVFDNQYGSPVSYVFTKLNDIKPKMLEEATKNAEASAREFAKSSDSEVGKIRRANQGVFSILPAEQTMNASEMTQINKKVRVVSTIEYWLK